MSKDLVEKVGNMYEWMEEFSRAWQPWKQDLKGKTTNGKENVMHEKFC